MSRIRSIKPEFWGSLQVVECSRDARLMFIGLWNFCDDEGRMQLSYKQLKVRVFPGDEDITTEAILGLVAELSKNGLIAIYEINGVTFLQVTGWYHQRIDKPTPSKIPPISSSDSSANDPGMVADDSSISRARAEGSMEGGKDRSSDRSILTGKDSTRMPRASPRPLERRASSRDEESESSAEKAERGQPMKSGNGATQDVRSGTEPRTENQLTEAEREERAGTLRSLAKEIAGSNAALPGEEILAAARDASLAYVEKPPKVSPELKATFGARIPPER